MKRDIIKSSRKFKKRRKLRGKDSEFYMGRIEFEMPVVSPGIDVQKVIGNNEKSEMTVNIWEVLVQGSFFFKMPKAYYWRYSKILVVCDIK